MFFFLRSQVTAGQQRDCGSVSISAKGTPLPKIHLPDSIKKWQNTYFYVRNLTEVDRIGLPAFSNSRPADKSWGRKPVVDEDLQSILFARLEKLVEDGLTTRDLTLGIVSFVERSKLCILGIIFIGSYLALIVVCERTIDVA